MNNGTLRIGQASYTDRGIYKCIGSSAAGADTVSVRLYVSALPPVIQQTLHENTSLPEGGTAYIHCTATGAPQPVIRWITPDGIQLTASQLVTGQNLVVFPNGTLYIRGLGPRNAGRYECSASNTVASSRRTVILSIRRNPSSAKASITSSSPQRTDVIYGSKLLLNCVATGEPEPRIIWRTPSKKLVDIEQKQQRSRQEVVRIKVKVATYPPQVQGKDQRTVRVFYGETVTLGCNTKGEPLPLITWISPTNKVISPALDKYQILDDGTLVVQKAQRFDGGNYTCMARNSAGQDHKVTRLEVLVTPPVINGLRGTTNAIKVTAVQDQLKLVDCMAKGTPTPRIMWVLPGNVILPAPYYSNRMAVHLNGTLEIRSPKTTDSGQLACIARNEGGEVRLVVNLDVKEVVKRPQIRGSKTDSLSLTVGNAMTLNCSLEGSTLPHITWILPSGTPLRSGARFSKFFHRPDGSLIISNPSIAEVGMYRCLGHNSGGLVERTITLSPGRKAEINNIYNSPVSVMNGETLLLHCQASGEPLRLAWTLPSGVVLNRPQRAGRYAILPNGTLAIHQVSVYDRGGYVCRAANEFGSSLLSVSVIVIAYPPRITSGPPSVTYAKLSLCSCYCRKIPATNQVTLLCITLWNSVTSLYKK
uniref:Ig-like domain-containing protein n=1 Tax=Amphiprion ocellaris TaxID=80972 RepID=A0AAQ5Y0U0_AMPOC